MSHGTNVKSEKTHINAEEMLDAAEVHYSRFGEFLSLLLLFEPIECTKETKNYSVALIFLSFVQPESTVIKIFEILNGCLTYLIWELDAFF
jgi:hypothetical protein